MNEQEKTELAKALEEFFAQENSTDKDTPTNQQEESLENLLDRISKVDTTGWNWDNRNLIENELRPHLDAIKEICERENMSYLFCVTSRFVAGSYGLHSEIGLYSKVCEFLACLNVFNLPHDVSHQIMHTAVALGGMIGFNPFHPLGKEDDEE